MIPTQAFLQLEELLSAKDTGHELDPLSCGWSPELAAACESRLSAGATDERKQIIRLLARMAAEDAKAILLGYLPSATEEDVADVMRGLTAAGIKIPSDQIVRWLDKVAIPAIVAAGLSGDAGLAAKLESLLQKSDVGPHAALALALLGHKQSSEKIARRIPVTKSLECVGFIVALEVMNDAAVVPLLRDYLLLQKSDSAWDLGHALWRLTGREPLVRIESEAVANTQAVVAAWRNFDLGTVPRPRLEHEIFEPTDRMASFDVLDGKGKLCIDFDPPTPGSSWPRWDSSVYLDEQRFYTIGSQCGTCETTLRLIGMSADRAAFAAVEMREALGNLEAPNPELLRVLSPLLTEMRTGHYLVCVVDMDLEYVTLPERSWLTQRLIYRRKSDGSFCDPGVIHWPGTEHFQVLKPLLDDVPTYGLVLPTSPLTKLDRETVEHYEDGLRNGARPAALLLAWVENKNVEGEFPERFLVSTVLDGHHKLMAYHHQGIPARCLVISRLEDCWGPREDRSLWLRQSLSGFQHKKV
jgi:hypothetical protein